MRPIRLSAIPNRYAVLFVVLGALLPWCGACSGGGAPSGSARVRDQIREIITSARDKVYPALVHIQVITVNYWDGKEHKGRAVGSGTIITPEGHVLTNQHVTAEGRKFRCTLADKQEVSATMVGEDPLTDLAVLKIELSELKDPKSLPTARFGDSEAVQTGDYVMAMGSPFALSRTVTLGIVANDRRVFAEGTSSEDVEDMELEEGQRTGLFTRWIQHDALINPGNSGGPLVNLKGEIVGINELGGASMGFAIPSNLARPVAETLIAKGEVVRSWIGVSLKPIKRTGLTEGVLVNSVAKDSPADKAGIQPGDLIVRLGEDPVTIRFVEELPPLLKRLADLPVGSTVSLAYKRGQKTTEARLVTEKLQKDRGKQRAFRAWGLTAQEITEWFARNWRLEDTKGVLVSSIRDGGSAQLAEPPLAYGDVLRSIDGKPIADLDEFIARYQTIMETDPLPEYVMVEFDRGGKSQLTLLKTKPDKDEDQPREVRKAWIGIATQPLLEKLAEKLDLGEQVGYRVTRVYPKTLAAKADLKVGDVITALNGSALKPKGMQDTGLLGRMVRKLSIDDEATLTILRDGRRKNVKVVLEPTRLTPEEARHDRNRDFELTVREVTFFDRDERRWEEETAGVLVTQVESAGWADLGGVQGGDLIQKIDEYEVRDLEGYRRAMAAITKAQPKRVVMVVLRGVRTRFLYLEPDWKPVSGSDDPDAESKPSAPASQAAPTTKGAEK